MNGNEFQAMVDRVQHWLAALLQESGEVPFEQLWQQHGDLRPADVRDAVRVLVESGQLVYQSGPMGPCLKARAR